jgi:hypothetical protein
VSVVETYQRVREELDLDYVEEVARAVAASLRRGEPLGVAFQPGDGTRYDLLFVPTQSLRHAAGRVVGGERWGAVTDFGISREPGTAFVAWYRSGGAGFDFRSGGFEPVYLNEVFSTTMGSACALAILFNATAEAFGA